MDTGTDQGTDPGEEGRWLTYGELAAIRRIDRHSAVKLVVRHGWRRQKDNHGQLRILVPSDWTAPKDKGMPTSVPVSVSDTTDTGTDIAHVVSAFEAGLAMLREQLQGAERRAEAAEKGREAERGRADDLRARIEALQAQLAEAQAAAQREAQEIVQAETEANELRAQVNALQGRLAEAQAAAQAVDELRQADAARRARGLLARLRAAWRGR